ncbi:putative copper resistance protein D [Kibdelosporangium banguiense]|uniref:Copper resistance protein D n=2 Tax=Kibdelosporangium banguiense TaxID=1365924 RepID=A0ABS4TBK0_9PSEU|nr:CopD family protein [Kibdelosporangium banguiense]MBP2321795.1 putative copper resistance protein D [Kibdelosporangium banguiense]
MPARAVASGRLTLVTILVTAALAGVLIGLAITATRALPGLPQPDAMVRYGIPVVRVLLDMAAVVTVGLCLLPLLIGFDRPKLAEAVLAGTRRVTVASALTWGVTALVALVLQTAELRLSESVTLSAVWEYIRTVGAGKALVAVFLFAMLCAGLAAWSVRKGESVPAELRAAAAMFTLLPLPVTGHATNWTWHDITMVSMELHVMAAVTWTGGLGAVVVLLATNRTLLAHALPRFSKLAAICLVVSAGTGLFNAFAELLLTPGSALWRDLFGTSYGVLVLLKITCVGLLAVLGANIRWRLLPGILRHQRTALVGWAAIELTIMGLAFGFAVILTRAPVA